MIDEGCLTMHPSQLNSHTLPVTNFSCICKDHLFFFEKSWTEILSSERANPVLSLVVLTINIVIVLK